MTSHGFDQRFADGSRLRALKLARTVHTDVFDGRVPQCLEPTTPLA